MDQLSQRRADGAQSANLLIDIPELLLGEGSNTLPVAAFRSSQAQQVLRLGQAESELLGSLDEPDQPDGFRRIPSVA